MREYSKIEFEDGTFQEEEMYTHKGRRHRDGGPAVTRRERDGSTLVMWYRQGVLHRDDGPARIQRAPDERVTSEEYYRVNRHGIRTPFSG
jgi:hypothetical protein